MRRTATTLIAIVATATLGLAGATTALGAVAAKNRPKPKLVRFDSCKAFNAYAKRHTLRRVEPWGLSGTPGVRAIGDGAGDLDSTLGDGAPPAPSKEPATESAGVPGQDFSTTTIQEAGVDEPDIVKTDGLHLYVVSNGELHVIEARATLPRLIASVPLPEGWEHELFLHDGHAIVLTRASAVFPSAAASVELVRYSFAGITTLTEVDVRTPSAPTIVESYSVEGSYLTARLIGSTLRVVTTAPSPIGLDFVFPADGSDETQSEALRTNRTEIRSARSRDWIPRYTHTDHGTETATEGKAVPCRRIRRPATFAGLGTVTILTFDLMRGLKPVDQDSVMTSGDTVYASARNIYVATQRWLDVASVNSVQEFAGAGTLIHRFSTAGPRSTVYRGAGKVRGFVLNQFALSEHEGHLRVATTDTPLWWPMSESQSFVTTLELKKGAMPRAGRVGGLGRGERIFAVRFIGDMGYVVTFRRIDPLYTVDLADPHRPTVRGELKIAGFSAYLHPISSTHLIGVGQDATILGRTLGTQISLFDVSDPADPTRVDKVTIASGYSEAEYDHRAFLWWAPSRLSVLPVQAFEHESGSLRDWFVGAASFYVDPDERGNEVSEAGRITHPTPGPKSAPEPWRAAIRRSVVVGDRLFTIGSTGVGVSDLVTLGRTAWVPLPQPPSELTPPVEG
jgi:hypothetical protein